MKLEYSWQFFQKFSNIKFHENLCSGSQVDSCRQAQTDRPDEANSCFLQFCKLALKLKVFIIALPFHSNPSFYYMTMRQAKTKMLGCTNSSWIQIRTSKLFVTMEGLTGRYSLLPNNVYYVQHTEIDGALLSLQHTSHYKPQF